METKQKFYELTEDGKKKLEDELYELTKKGGLVDKNIIALQDARAQGDLSENADYDAARDEQARLDARVKELKEILKNVKIISVDSSDNVTTGKTVTILFVENNKTATYSITGTIEANPFEGRISNESPLGKTILGHKKGETVAVVTENGHEFHAKIVDVK